MPAKSAATHAVLETLARVGDVIIGDQLNHASIVDGCRLSRTSVRVVPHRPITPSVRLFPPHAQGVHAEC
jgi:7-keto-8-aminopelargonate synthetase-like enzyme